MQKRSFKQRASAVALAAAMAITLSVAPTTQANAASKQKVNVITTAKTSGGDTIKYTYNKKGLVKKSVTTSSRKDSNIDESVKTTVTYKYNKKNKITSETKKVVTKDTYYKTDETTGNKRGAKEGQITTTDTTVTKYTYNKKGLATKSVATTTSTKSGSVTTTKQTLGVANSDFDSDFDYDVNNDSNNDSNKELEDGSVIAGYNKYNANGTVNNEHTKTNAYYYDNKLASLSTTTTTETYSAGKDGTYTYTSTNNTTGSYKTEYDETHYGYVTINGAETLVTLIPQTRTYDYGEGSYTDYVYVYQDPAGNIYNPDNQFTVVNKVNVIASAVPSTSTTVTSDVVSDKSVTTTKYTYDKKKRLKKAVSTTVDSSTKANTYNSSTSSANYKSEKATKNDSTSENTATVTTKYTYDKKGRVKKTVYTDPGKDTYKSTTSYMTMKDYEQYYDDKGVATSIRNHDYTCAAGYTDVTNISVENNVRTVTKTKNPYSDTYTVLGNNPKDSLSDYGYNANAYGKSTVTGTKTYTFYGNGGSQIEDKFTESGIGETYDAASHTYVEAPFTKTGTVNRHTFDKNGTTNGTIYTYEKYNAGGSLAYKDSGASYYNGIKHSYGDEATVALAPAIATNASNGTVYNYVTTETEPATPVKETTKYVYDKTGNVKTANVKGTSTSVYTVKNETYGNSIYKFDTAGKLQEVKTTYTNKYTNKKSNENTVKTGTKNLTKVLKTSKGKYNMSSYSGYNLDSRIIYTLKGKKYASKNAKLVKKQQWMIQNGRLNGVVGLY